MRPWTGLSSQSSRVWFNARTGDAYSANDDQNHTNGILQNLTLFGLTPEKLQQYGIPETPTSVRDYYGPLLFAAMQEGWVRLRIDAREPDYKSNAEGAQLRAIRKAVIWYAENIGPPKQFIIATRTGPGDRDGQGWRLNADQLEFFIQKGIIPRDRLTDSAHPMRRLIDIITESTIDESGAGPSRIVTHIRDGVPFFTISATRGERPHTLNLKLTKGLREKLNSMQVSVIEIEGEYLETRPDGQKQKQKEFSFFVMPKKALGPMGLDRFEQIGLLLARQYNQETIGFGDGNTIYFVKPDGSREDFVYDAVTFDEGKIKDLFGFSEIKDRKFSFTKLADHPDAVAYNRPLPAKRERHNPRLP